MSFLLIAGRDLEGGGIEVGSPQDAAGKPRGVCLYHRVTEPKRAPICIESRGREAGGHTNSERSHVRRVLGDRREQRASRSWRVAIMVGRISAGAD